MGFRAEVRKFMSDQRAENRSVVLYQKVLGVVMSEVTDLRKTNKDLMDRLMARDFEQLKIYQEPEEGAHVSLTSDELEPDEDDGNAGEIL